MLSSAFADKYIEIEKPINLRITTLDHMFQNVETFASMFGDEIEIKGIQGTGNSKSAHIFIDVPFGCDVDTSISATKQKESYVMSFQGRNLDGSIMAISLEPRWGWNDKTGDPEGATNVFLVFDGKDIPCETRAAIAGFSFEDTFNDGLYRLQQKGLPIEKQLEQQNNQKTTEIKPKSTDQKSQETTETKPKQVELRGPPRIDSDNDGISDEEDSCLFEKEIFNGYLDRDGCPDEIPDDKPIPAFFVDTSKDPQYYIDRYFNESEYRNWFDRNYPQYSSIYEAVGLIEPSTQTSKQTQSVIPETKAEPKKTTPENPSKTAKKDRDGDGIADKDDLCPNKAEVYNGYIDWDGCPDTETGQIKKILDGDRDGVLNHYDNCPNMKEVHNGFKDNDGCPDAVMQNHPYQENETPIPDWVKSNAKWYSVGSITERDFAQSLQYMIKDDIIHIEKTGKGANSEFSVGQIPNWVQTSAGWWADGKMTDKEFVKTIQHLVDSNIITIY